MRFFPQELYIKQLKGKAPRHPRLNWLRSMSKEECLANLREISGLDLGDDPEAWEKWWEEEQQRWEEEEQRWVEKQQKPKQDPDF